MLHTAFRRASLAMAAAATVAAVGAGALAAAPAGASASFTPALSPVTPAPAQTLAAEKAAPYTLLTSTRKKLTPPKPTATRRGATSRKSASVRRSAGSEAAQAQRLLAAQIAKHPILQGTTVTFGNARGYQAIAYYSSGRIVISANHRASLERIISHEVWHVIDWRDNGRIDWGERVPH